jgi:hypothetical protein
MTAPDNPVEHNGPEPVPRSFAVGYNPSGGEIYVYGGASLIVIGCIITAVQGHPAALLLSLVGLGSTLYYRPLMEPRRPQLGASMQGLYVERIGIIGWRAISDIDMTETYIRTMRFTRLVVTLSMPLDKATVQPEVVTSWRRYTSRNWSIKGNRLEIKLDTLRADPEVVLRRVKAFQRMTGPVRT